VEYFEGRDGLLRQRLARGFVCRFMNYIKTHVSEGGEVYALAEAWPDPVTFAIVSAGSRPELACVFVWVLVWV
jgi:hypothetical protein